MGGGGWKERGGSRYWAETRRGKKKCRVLPGKMIYRQSKEREMGERRGKENKWKKRLLNKSELRTEMHAKDNLTI
jgi:hypothetical protein